KQFSPAQYPGTGWPLPALLARVAREREHVSGGCVEAPREDAAQATEFLLVLHVAVFGLHVYRQPAFALQIVERVFERRLHILRVETQPPGQHLRESMGLLRAAARLIGFSREQIRIGPQRHAIPAPATAQCPAGQGLARIPLALSEVQQRSLGVANSQAV